MSRIWKGMVLAPWLTLVWASNALAQEPGERVGNNIKETFQPILFWVWLIVLGAYAISCIGPRQANKFAIIALVGLGAGIFVMSPEGVGDLVKAFGDKLTSGF